VSRFALHGALLLLLTGCSAKPPPPPAPPPPPKPATLSLAITCGADQNPDAAGQPEPLAMRLYLLTDQAKFEHADFFALTEREHATLGDDVVASEELLMRPGEMRSIERTPKPGVQALGVAALFRDIDHATWRAIQPIAATGPTRLRLATAGLGISLQPQPPPPESPPPGKADQK
jgi:type VI secretion system protein VasD